MQMKFYELSRLNSSLMRKEEKYMTSKTQMVLEGIRATRSTREK